MILLKENEQLSIIGKDKRNEYHQYEYNIDFYNTPIFNKLYILSSSKRIPEMLAIYLKKQAVDKISNWYLEVTYNPKYLYCRNKVKKNYDELYNENE